MNKSGSSSVGRAIAFQAIGREFEPRLPLLERSEQLAVAIGGFFGRRTGYG